MLHCSKFNYLVLILGPFYSMIFIYFVYQECSKCSVRVTNKKDIKRHIYTVHSADSQDKLVNKVSKFLFKIYHNSILEAENLKIFLGTELCACEFLSPNWSYFF